jgi:predicted metal-dependent HD superfamily phosphohydrolase
MTTKIQNREEMTIDYNQNIRRLLGWENLDMKILKTSAGILKNFLKKSPIWYQRKLRKEWERKPKLK